MDAPDGRAAPESGSNDNQLGSGEGDPDPEILALLDFEPVPRKREVEGGWTPALQREFIVRLAAVGAPGRVCEEMGKHLTGLMKLYRSPLAESFRAAWDGAVEIARRRKAEQAPQADIPQDVRAPKGAEGPST